MLSHRNHQKVFDYIKKYSMKPYFFFFFGGSSESDDPPDGELGEYAGIGEYCGDIGEY